MLIPMEPKAYWQLLRTIMEEVVAERMQQNRTNRHLERPLLKTKEVCEIFHISKPTIYEWLRQGKIKSVKIQSRRFFHWNDIDELIQTSKADSSAIISK